MWVVDALRDTVVATLPAMPPPNSTCYSLAGNVLYGDYPSGPGRDTVMRVDARASRIADSLMHLYPTGDGDNWSRMPPGRRSLWYNPISRRVLAYRSQEATSIDLNGMEHAEPQWGGVEVLEYVPDAKLAFVVNPWQYHNIGLRMIDLVHDSLIGSVRVGSIPLSMAWYPDSSRLFVGNRDGSSISVVRVDVPTRE